MSDPAKVAFNATYRGKTWALYGKQYTSEQITEWFEAAYGFKPDMIMEIGGGKLAGPKPEKPQITTVEIERPSPAPTKRKRKRRVPTTQEVADEMKGMRKNAKS